RRPPPPPLGAPRRTEGGGATRSAPLRVGYAAVAKLPMGALLAYHSERDPSRIAVRFHEDTITYGDLDRWANRLARAYADLGVGLGDLVTIALANGIEFYAAAFAAYKLGAIPQPLPHRLP